MSAVQALAVVVRWGAWAVAGAIVWHGNYAAEGSGTVLGAQVGQTGAFLAWLAGAALVWLVLRAVAEGLSKGAGGGVQP